MKMTTTTTTMSKTTKTMTGNATNGFGGLYGYERSLDGYDDDDVCSGEDGSGGWGLLGEEECKVEDWEWSIAVVAAADNANPQPAGSIVLDKTPGVRLMREYESIVVASAASSSSDDDDDGMSIYDDFDNGGRFEQRKVQRRPTRHRRALERAHLYRRQRQ
jgi:hypothetical protein